MRVAFAGKGGGGKSFIAATFARSLARAQNPVLALDLDTMPGLRVIANKTRTPADLQMIRAALGVELTEVPEDPSVLAADRDGESVFDTAPRGPAVMALSSVAAAL